MSEPTPSFLFINVARIGDTLFVTPAMQAVVTAYPGCQITALAHPKRAEVLQHLPLVAQVGSITKKTAPWRGRFGGRRYDYALVYGHDEPLVAYALRVADRVVAFRQKDEGLNRRMYRCVEEPPPQTKHAVPFRLSLAEAIGVPPAGARLIYQVTPEEDARARSRLAADVPPGASPVVGMHVATFPKKTFRRWPIEHFAQLADRILSDWPHAHFLIYGGEEEPERTQWLKQRLEKRATLYAGVLTLRETGALMRLTDLYVGLDTGPTYVMSAFDIPLIALYHCRIPSRYVAPLDHPCCYVLDHPRLDQADCTEETPMSEISVETVYAAVQKALTEHPPTGHKRAAKAR